MEPQSQAVLPPLPPAQVADSGVRQLAKDLIGVVFSLGYVFLILFFFLSINKHAKKNWEIEKSVMKPSLKVSVDSQVSNAIFNLQHDLKANLQDLAIGLSDFKRKMYADFGVVMKKTSHSLNNGGSLLYTSVKLKL